MEHRLVMVTGSSMGAGKTTVSQALAQQFRHNGIHTHWRQEEVLEAAFSSLSPHWNTSHLTPADFLAVCRTFTQQVLADDGVYITDSVLPGFIRFFGKYPFQELCHFNQDLFATLHPLQPVLVYLQSDIDSAFDRALVQRGSQWIENIRRYLNTWDLPLYSSDSQPFQHANDVRAYFRSLDSVVQEFIAMWPGKVIHVDTSSAPLPDVVDHVLHLFDLSPHMSSVQQQQRSLSDYTGLYLQQDSTGAPSCLGIFDRDGDLFVDTYWPIGTRLVYTKAHDFRLAETDRWISFQCDTDNAIIGLHYSFLGQSYRYHKQL